MIKVSIIVTSCNSCHTIHSCLESIHNQTYKNIEIIAVDGGSYDGTLKIIKDHKNKHKNVSFFQHKKASVAQLRNYGLEKATGDFVLFIASNTFLNMNGISILVSLLEEKEADIAVCSMSHPYFAANLKSQLYDLNHKKDFYHYQDNFFASTMLTNKLIRKECIGETRFKETVLNEELFNLEILPKVHKIVTTEIVLCVSQEHKPLFETPKFWKDQKSFWFQAQQNKCLRKDIYKQIKPLLPKFIVPDELIHNRNLDYFLWEMMVYTEQNASLEALVIETFTILQNPNFKKTLLFYERYGLKFTSCDEEKLLKQCLLWAYAIQKSLTFIKEVEPRFNLIYIFNMIFISIFLHQNATLDVDYFLCYLRDELNLNELPEAQYVNQLNL